MYVIVYSAWFIIVLLTYTLLTKNSETGAKDCQKFNDFVRTFVLFKLLNETCGKQGTSESRNFCPCFDHLLIILKGERKID